MDWLDRFGKWYIEIWLSETLLIEVGIGMNHSASTNEVYQVTTKKFLFMYITVARPTLKYMIQDAEIIKARE